MSACRSKVDRGPAFEIPTQNEGIVVQQGSQAVLTARHSLWPGERSGRSDLLLQPVNDRTSPFFHSFLLKHRTSGREKGLFHPGLSRQRKPPACPPSRSHAGGPQAEDGGLRAPPGRRDALTPRCSAVLPLLSAASAVEPFSSRRWTQSTWPFMIASISGVLRGEGRGSSGESGLGNQLGCSAALSCPPATPRHIPGETPAALTGRGCP